MLSELFPSRLQNLFAVQGNILQKFYQLRAKGRRSGIGVYRDIEFIPVRTESRLRT